MIKFNKNMNRFSKNINRSNKNMDIFSKKCSFIKNVKVKQKHEV